jgi:hypothetical protein
MRVLVCYIHVLEHLFALANATTDHDATSNGWLYLACGTLDEIFATMIGKQIHGIKR